MKTKYPCSENRNNKCIVCSKNLDGKFFVANLGALKNTGPDKYGMLEKEDIAFLSLITHNHDANDVEVEIADSRFQTHGQIDFYFCGGNCMKKFFSRAVDELVKKHRKANGR